MESSLCPARLGSNFAARGQTCIWIEAGEERCDSLGQGQKSRRLFKLLLQLLNRFKSLSNDNSTICVKTNGETCKLLV